MKYPDEATDEERRKILDAARERLGWKRPAWVSEAHAAADAEKAAVKKKKDIGNLFPDHAKAAAGEGECFEEPSGREPGSEG
jgi:hypothetical protein